MPGFRLDRLAVGGRVLVIDAKNDRATEWYASYGAVPLLDAERTLVLPLATIAGLLEDVGKLAASSG